MEKVFSGSALSLDWSKSRDEYHNHNYSRLFTVSPVNSKGEFVTVEEKLELQKTNDGFFK